MYKYVTSRNLERDRAHRTPSLAASTASKRQDSSLRIAETPDQELFPRPRISNHDLSLASAQLELSCRGSWDRHIASFRIALQIPRTCQRTFQSSNRHQKCKLIWVFVIIHHIIMSYDNMSTLACLNCGYGLAALFLAILQRRSLVRA